MKQKSSCKNNCACPKSKRKKPSPQNGKGDSPRNLSSEFRDNYDQIKWPKKKA